MSILKIRLPRLAMLVALPMLTLLIAGCEQAVNQAFPPEAVTSQGQEIRNLYDIVFAIAVVVFLIVEGLIVYAVIRYRRRPGETELPPQIHGNNLIEVVWTVIPTVIVAFLFFISWQTLNSVDATSKTPDVRIRAIAQQFQWSFEYLSDDGQQVLFKQIAPEMAVPAGQTVQLSLRSPDVIHAFYVPQFLFKRDVVPGRENIFDFTVDATDAGRKFHGQCAELCGTFHGAMEFTVTAMAPAEFDAWLTQQIEAAKATPAPAPGGEAAGPALEVTAETIAFKETNLTAAADAPFTIKFTNNDAGVPHNVAIHEGSPTGQEVFRGEIFNGVDTRTYAVPALKAGTYGFVCTVHPNMTGTLTVQ